jgi:hypothetical protein
VSFKAKLITPDWGTIGAQSSEFGRTALIFFIGMLLVLGALFVFRDKDGAGKKVERAHPTVGFP